MRMAVGILLACAAIAAAACGGGDEDTNGAVEAAASGPCEPIEEVEVGPVQHSDQEYTAADYTTNPPAWGDHNDPALQAGSFFRDGAPLGEAVHFLEHGAVIGWTNGLSAGDERAVEQEFNDVFGDGYYQLAVVENPDMDVPFALSAWGAVQTCGEVDTSVIRPFVEQWYASPKSPESGLACSGEARRLPPC
jgi:Protein of unknown function (DUF3105)